MNISRIRALRGPNLWNRSTAIEAIVTCSGNESDLSLMPEFIDRLRKRFPDIGALPEPTAQGVISMAHALELATLALQTHAGCQVAFSRTAQAPEPGVFQVVVEYTDEAVGRMALALAEALIRSAVEDTAFDTLGAISQLRALDEDVRMGPSTAAIVDAAVARGIPYRRLTQGSLVQLGWAASSGGFKLQRSMRLAQLLKRSRKTRNSPSACYMPPEFRCPRESLSKALRRPGLLPASWAALS